MSTFMKCDLPKSTSIFVGFNASCLMFCFVLHDQGPRTNSYPCQKQPFRSDTCYDFTCCDPMTHGSVTMGEQGPVFTVSHLARTAFPPPYSSTSTSSSSKSVQSRILNTHSACSPIQSQSHATPLYKLDLEYSPQIKTGF